MYLLQFIWGLIENSKLTPHLSGRVAKLSGLSPGKTGTTGLRHLQTFWRSRVVIASSFIRLIPSQHGEEGSEKPGLVINSTHGYKVSSRSLQAMAALANGMAKTKHITDKQVILTSIEVAMIWKFWWRKCNSIVLVSVCVFMEMNEYVMVSLFNDYL